MAFLPPVNDNDALNRNMVPLALYWAHESERELQERGEAVSGGDFLLISRVVFGVILNIWVLSKTGNVIGVCVTIAISRGEGGCGELLDGNISRAQSQPRPPRAQRGGSGEWPQKEQSESGRGT